MFDTIYVFSLGLGGALLLMSLFMGGDHDGDADADMDADADVEADGGADQGQQAVHHGGDTHGSLGGLFTIFLSLRFWTFFLAFFGLTGLVIDGLDLVDGSWVPFGTAAAVGLATGYVAVAVIRGLSRGESGKVGSTTDYVGATARVLIPVSREELGKVRLQVRGTTVDLLARTNDDVPLAAGARAMILQIDDTTAVVTAAQTQSEDVP